MLDALYTTNINISYSILFRAAHKDERVVVLHQLVELLCVF